MKKILLGACAFSLFVGSVSVVASTVGDVASTVWNSRSSANQGTGSQPRQNVESSAEATPVTYTDADYSEGAGDTAAVVDAVSGAVSSVISIFSSLYTMSNLNVMAKELQHLETLAAGTASSQPPSVPLMFPVGLFSQWASMRPGFDVIAIISDAVQAATNKYLRDTQEITASFIGDHGYVTDKWVGPPSLNIVTKILSGPLDISPSSFEGIQTSDVGYEEIGNFDTATQRELMEYRQSTLLEDQRSLSNEAEKNKEARRLAQQRSIHALKSALSLKANLKDLAEIDSEITAQYDSATTALATLASRMAVYDALLVLRMNVIAARTKMRAETLELDFKPMEVKPGTVTVGGGTAGSSAATAPGGMN